MAITAKQTERNIESELTTLAALVDEFEDYIVDGQVYRTVLVTTKRGNYRLEMSGGDLLARIQLLQEMRTDLPGPLKDQLNSIITQAETTKQELKTRLHDLLRRELAARLDTLKWEQDRRDDDESKEEEEEEITPAESHNRHCIAIIREELNS